MTEVTSVGTLNVVFVCVIPLEHTGMNSSTSGTFQEGILTARSNLYTCTQGRLTYELEAWNN